MTNGKKRFLGGVQRRDCSVGILLVVGVAAGAVHYDERAVWPDVLDFDGEASLDS
jgi:hypothetical protein